MKLIHVFVALLSSASIFSVPVDQNITTPAAAPLANANQANPGLGSNQQQSPANNPQPTNGQSGSGGNNKSKGSTDSSKPSDAAKTDQSNPADNDSQKNKDNSQGQSTSPTTNPSLPYDQIQGFFKQLGNADPKAFKKLIDDISAKLKQTFVDFNTIMTQFNKLEPEKKKIVVLWSGDVANRLTTLSSQEFNNFGPEAEKWILELQKALQKKEGDGYGKYLSSYFSQLHSKSIDDVGQNNEQDSDDRPRRFAFFSSIYEALH